MPGAGQTGEAAVRLDGLVKRFGPFTALHAMDLVCEEGSFITFLGPSGCGKTTTLRMIAGLESATEGDIVIRGRRVNDVPIHRRNLGLVFQNYALFPHKSVFDNVAFGLKYRKVSRSDVETRVKAALELVQLPQMADRYPAQLSGGQQQRIALARAIVIEPDVLLLDEPLSALDANLREDMRVELKRIQARLGITTIFVTHDQSEALAMSDRIVVMSAGHVEQVGTPETVYNRPASGFVARFLGNANLLPATVDGAAGDRRLAVTTDGGDRFVCDPDDDKPRAAGDRVQLMMRAEKLLLAADHTWTDDVNVFPATVDAVDYQGQAARYFLTAGGQSLQAINPIDRHPFAAGSEVQVAVKPWDCVLLDA